MKERRSVVFSLSVCKTLFLQKSFPSLSPAVPGSLGANGTLTNSIEHQMYAINALTRLGFKKFEHLKDI
jgi:hypothetical protein